MPRVTMGCFGHIDLAGPTHRIRAGDREWLFEFAPGGGLAGFELTANRTAWLAT